NSLNDRLFRILCKENDDKFNRLLLHTEVGWLSKDVVKDIEDVEVFGIMCDEARCYKQEQMALCVRYVKNLDVVERFLGFINCSKNQDAESLYHYIL
ncbi:Domain of unknown function DUF4371, partial [Cinara cedri]